MFHGNLRCTSCLKVVALSCLATVEGGGAPHAVVACSNPPLKPRVIFNSEFSALTHHMSMGVEYSVEPSSTSGGRYHRVTTSLE